MTSLESRTLHQLGKLGLPSWISSRDAHFIPYKDGDTSTQLNSYKNFDYFFNNMRAVLSPSYHYKQKYPDKPPITITHYNQPPMIATLASSFRRWRGDMQYRIRTVAGFATQGYVFVSSLKNIFSPIGVYDSYNWQVRLKRQSKTFRPSMMNSYILADTSMFRHLEITSVFDYPVAYYDQLAWIDRRCNPQRTFGMDEKKQITPRKVKGVGNVRDFGEPHGDNWLVFGVRGNLAAAQQGAQIIFELEYRCVEGFQFADPWLPPADALNDTVRPGVPEIIVHPNKKWVSDGLQVASGADEEDIVTPMASVNVDKPAESRGRSYLSRLGQSSRN